MIGSCFSPQSWRPLLWRTANTIVHDQIWLNSWGRSAWLCFSVISSLLATAAPANVWQHVNMQPDARPERVTVSKAQFDAVKETLTAGKGTLGGWPCDSEEGDWTQKLVFEELPVSSTEKVMLVEAGTGCARGGQGANGAMWVVRFKGDKPILLATPQHDFNGWLYSIQPGVSHGLHDLVLGWHMGAFGNRFELLSFRRHVLSNDRCCLIACRRGWECKDRSTENGPESAVKRTLSRS